MIWDLKHIADKDRPLILVGSKHHNYKYAFSAKNLKLYSLLNLHSPMRNIFVDPKTSKQRYWEAIDYLREIDKFIEDMKEEQFQHSISEEEITGKDYAEVKLLLYQLVRDTFATLGLLDNKDKEGQSQSIYAERVEVH